MKTIFMMVGKTNDKNIIELVEDYSERLKHYNIGYEIQVIPQIKNTKNLSEDQQKQLEGIAFLKNLQAGDYVVLLDEKGKEYTSEGFAEWMIKRMNMVSKRLVFIIGGPYGFSKDVYSRKNDMISLSRMTFSHQMVRLVFVEQLYRAMTIINNEPYHHS